MTYSRETKIGKERDSGRIDDDISLEKQTLDVNMRECVDNYPFQVPMNNGWVHGVQDMDALTDTFYL